MERNLPMQHLITPLIERTAEYRARTEGVRINARKRSDVDGPEFRIAARPMKRVHSAGPAEIVLCDVFVERVEAQILQA